MKTKIIVLLLGFILNALLLNAASENTSYFQKIVDSSIEFRNAANKCILANRGDSANSRKIQQWMRCIEIQERALLGYIDYSKKKEVLGLCLTELEISNANSCATGILEFAKLIAEDAQFKESHDVKSKLDVLEKSVKQENQSDGGRL